MHTCAHNTDDVEGVVQSICVRTIRVCDNLREYAYMLVMYMPNLVHMHIDVYMNCKPRITV